MSYFLTTPVQKVKKEKPLQPNLTQISRDLKEKYIFRTEVLKGKMYIYNSDEGYFKPNAEEFIKGILSDTLSNHQKNEIIYKIHDSTFVDRDLWNPYDNDLINMKNGVFDIVNKHLISHNPKYLFVNRFEIDYDPGAKCPIWIKFLNTSYAEEDVNYLQAWFKYHFIPRNPMKRLTVIEGKKHTGKSVTCSTLSNFIGFNNTEAVSMKYFSDSPMRACAQLYTKKAGIYPDMGEHTISDVDAIKAYCGNSDSVQAAFMCEDAYSYVPNAKLTFGCNRLPQLSIRVQEDAAWWDRVKLIRTICTPFDPLTRDNDIDKKILSEISGIFNWAMSGDLNLLKSSTPNVDALWQESVDGANPLKEFIDQYYDKDIDEYTMVKFIKNLWNTYRHDHKIIDISDIKFNIYMSKLGFIQDRIGEDRLSVWCGLKYKFPTS